MIVNCDIKGLEVVIAAQLSGDKVLCQEIINKEDIHGNNQTAFGLGDGKAGRLVAKVLKFRIIYGGGAYSFAHDPDFMGVSTSQTFWQDVIDKYYAKYKGIEEWHRGLVLEAQTNGQITIPSGRYYPIIPVYTQRDPWPLTIIKNYPVQGFGADCVMLARLRASQLIREAKITAPLVGTIHDSIVVDCPTEFVGQVAQILRRSVEEVPMYIKKLFKYDFFLPLTCEITSGPTKASQTLLDI